MLRKLLITAFAVMATALGAESAAAQCTTIGAKACQSGYIYVCEACGSEKCWIATSTRCLRDEMPYIREQRVDVPERARIVVARRDLEILGRRREEPQQ